MACIKIDVALCALASPVWTLAHQAIWRSEKQAARRAETSSIEAVEEMRGEAVAVVGGKLRGFGDKIPVVTRSYPALAPRLVEMVRANLRDV
jgi:hypothetical protein